MTVLAANSVRLRHNQAEERWSSSRRRWARCSSGMTSISTARSASSSPSISSPTCRPNVGFIFTLLAFAAGFAVRPFGALVFGRLGDIVGRKYTFLVTMTLMGLGTFLIGVLPSYAQLGHRRADRADRAAAGAGPRARRRIWRRSDLCRRACAARQRGYYTSWIQTTATLGLFMALLMILGIRTVHGRGGLRRLGLAHSVPALGILLVVSIWIRLKLDESPVFQR